MMTAHQSSTPTRWLIAGISLVLVLASDNASAFYCSNCNTIANGLQANIALSTLNGNVTAQTATLSQINKSSADAIMRKLDALTVATGKVANALAVSQRQTALQVQIGKEKAHAQQTYGAGSKTYTLDGVTHRPGSIPQTMCYESGRASAVGAAMDAVSRSIAQGVASDRMRANHYKSSAAAADAANNQPDINYQASYVMGSDGMTADQSKAANKWIDNVVNPTPAPALSDKHKNTQDGQEYERKRKEQNAHLGASVMALQTLKADNALTVPLGQDIKDKWAKINPNTKIVTSPNNDVSPLTVLRTEVEYRYASKEWTDRLVDINQMQAWRQFLMMKAIEMHMELKEYELDRQRTSLMAISDAQQTRNQDKSDLRKLRILAAGVTDSSVSNNGKTSH
jgi:hypothetical protein